MTFESKFDMYQKVYTPKSNVCYVDFEKEDGVEEVEITGVLFRGDFVFYELNSGYNPDLEESKLFKTKEEAKKAMKLKWKR